ncbi:hypothetical protein ACSBR1_008226 [Camellia fascicularis]
MSQLEGSNFELTMNDIQIWVSAALTDDNTCTDAMDSNVKSIVRGKIVNLAHLTSNTLALINSQASSLHV